VFIATKQQNFNNPLRRHVLGYNKGSVMCQSSQPFSAENGHYQAKISLIQNYCNVNVGFL